MHGGFSVTAFRTETASVAFSSHSLGCEALPQACSAGNPHAAFCGGGGDPGSCPIKTERDYRIFNAGEAILLIGLSQTKEKTVGPIIFQIVILILVVGVLALFAWDDLRHRRMDAARARQHIERD